MKRLWIILTILALLIGSGNPISAVAGGNIWTQCSQGMWGGHIQALVLSPGYPTDHTLFAGTYGGGVFKSTDDGASWSPVNTGLTNRWVHALALSPGYAADHTLFAGTDWAGGVFKSTDGGDSWNAVGLTGLWVQALALSPGYTGDHTLFAGTLWDWIHGGGVFKSTDGGASWSAVGLTNRSVYALALSPGYVTDHTLFAGTGDGGVFKSTDGGASWSATGFTHGAVLALALSPGYVTDRTLLAGTGSGVFKSTDEGASWSATGLTRYYCYYDVRAMALSPGYASDRTIFAGTFSVGVFKSTDGGDSWSAVNTGLANLEVRALALSPAYTTDCTLFAGTRDGGVFKSSDSGASWSAVNNGLTNLGVWALALSPGYATDHTLFAGTLWDWMHGGGVFKSTDGGASWSPVNTGLTDLGVRALALSPGYATDHTLFAGTYSGVFKSTDGGGSWSAVNTGLTNVGVRALALSPGYAADRTIFVGTFWETLWDVEGGVFKSTDGGASWSAVGLTDLLVRALALSPGYAADHTLFAGTEGGVFKSTDGGASWSATGLTYGSVYALALSPGYTSDRTLFAGTWGSGVFKSTDGGDSWSAINRDLPRDLVIWALALSPGYATDQTLLAGVSAWEGDWEGGGVFKSTDGGASWSAMNAGLGNLSIRSLALTPTFPRILFAGTEGSSVWQYTLLPNQVYLPLIVKAYEFDRLTYNPANDSQPALSPDNQTVVFISDRTGQPDVFSIPLMGRQLTNLTQTLSAQEDTPIFSPDGTTIAFASDRDGDWSIYLMDTDGTNVRPALSGYAGTDEVHPAFTPDSLALVFSSNRADGNWDIYSATIGASEWTRLTTHPAADRFPNLSADGGIAFRSERDGNSEIHLMDADGSNLRRVTYDPAFDGYPSIIPDGSGLVFVSNRSGKWNVYVTNLAGGGVTALEQRDGWQMDTPRLSSDGRLLLYAGGPTGGTLDIYKRQFTSPLMLIAQRGADNLEDHCDWEAGVLAYGWIHAWQTTQACPERERGDDQYRRWAQEWIDACIPTKTEITHVNDGLLGYAALVAYETSEQPEYLAFAQRVADYLMNTAPRTTDGTLTHDSNRVWVDSLLGAVPFLMKMSQISGSDIYLDEAISQVIQHADHLQDPVSGLYHHAWDACPEPCRRESGNDPAGEVYWGRGNGWALLADVEALSAITTTHPLRSTVLGIMQKQVAGLRPLQDASGLWHTVLTRPDSYLETSASALIGYAFKRGIQEDWLDEDAYAAVAQAATLGVWRQVLADGTVTNVSGPTWPMLTEEEYNDRPHDSFQLYGQGVALLLGSSVRQ